MIGNYGKLMRSRNRSQWHHRGLQGSRPANSQDRMRANFVLKEIEAEIARETGAMIWGYSQTAEPRGRGVPSGTQFTRLRRGTSNLCCLGGRWRRTSSFSCSAGRPKHRLPISVQPFGHIVVGSCVPCAPLAKDVSRNTAPKTMPIASGRIHHSSGASFIGQSSSLTNPRHSATAAIVSLSAAHSLIMARSSARRRRASA
jgi:hypothetical protein